MQHATNFLAKYLSTKSSNSVLLVGIISLPMVDLIS